MNNKLILPLALVCGILLGGYLSHLVIKPTPTVQQLSLEQILSIKELHPVKHTYHDCFFFIKRMIKQKPFVRSFTYPWRLLPIST